MTSKNYTSEEVTLMKNVYNAAENQDDRNLAVTNLAKRFNKPKASIVAKLSKEGVYIAAVRVSGVTGAKPETKEQIVFKIKEEFESVHSTARDYLYGLEKAPKLVLLKLLREIEELKANL